MKTGSVLVHILIVLSLLAAGPARATDVTADVIEDSTWTLAGSPYKITADVVIHEEVTLVIEAGVQIGFEGFYKLEVRGTLLAVGTPEAPIRFTSNQPSPAPGDWNSIAISGSADIWFCEVAYGESNIQVSGLPSSTAEAWIGKSVVRNARNDGLLIGENSAVLVTRNVVVENGLAGNGAGVRIVDASPDVIANTIMGNARGIELSYVGAQDPRIESNTILRNNRFSSAPFDLMYCDSCPLQDAPSPTDATSNFWGADTTVEMNQRGCNAAIGTLWDFHDQPTLGKVDYCQWLAEPGEATPVASPGGVTLTSIGPDGARLEWSVNPESDLLGYKVWWGADPHGPFAHSSDVGSETSHTISGLTAGTLYVSVTAYDTEADGIGDLFEGHESWFSEPTKVTVGEFSESPSVPIDWHLTDGPGAVDDYTEIDDIGFVDLPAFNGLPPVTFGPITITSDSPIVNCAFAAWPIGTAEDPGSGDGYCAWNTSFGTFPPVVLTFDSPVAAFGVSFYHFDPSRLGGNGVDPAVLSVYDGPNGTGNVIGSVSTSGFLDSLGLLGHTDFVGIWSDELDIRSAVLVGTGPNLGFGVDGYGVSLTPMQLNSPPSAVAAAPPLTECTSTQGASVVLDGSQSTDADSTPGTNDDIVSFEWFEDFGLPSELFLGTGEMLVVTLPLGNQLVTLRVTDGSGETGTAEVTVAVVDTAPPEITVGVDPESLWPPNHRLVDVAFSVVASDLCSSTSIVLTSVTSNEADNGAGDGNTTHDIQDAELGTPDFHIRLRAERAGGGNGRIYTAIYTATDAVGNVGAAAGMTFVLHDQGGMTDPLELLLEQSNGGALVSWSEVPGAQTFDVIRGQLSNLVETDHAISLGPVTCIESDSTDLSTTGSEDFDLPDPGQTFFYLVEYDDGTSSSYGTESNDKPRAPGPGDCP